MIGLKRIEVAVNARMQDSGSFRDPSGHVYNIDGRIFRTVTSHAADSYERVLQSGVLSSLQERGWLVASRDVEPSLIGDVAPTPKYLVEHQVIPFVSYPYEWPFSALKAAALLHLDLHLAVLERNITLSDASAYNVQFLGPNPVFIDLLSFCPYQDGEPWKGHRQFCEQFLNPLLLQAYTRLSYQPWYRGSLEGISAAAINAVLPFRKKCSLGVLSHVVLQAKLQKSALKGNQRQTARASRARLPRNGLVGMLTQLRRWIEKLEPITNGKTLWSDYASRNSYSSPEVQQKKRFISEFIQQTHPAMVWDLGCNSGDYSEVALESGAKYVVGFDADQGALEQAYQRAKTQRLNFLPLYLDAFNPSPDQGWYQTERKGLQARADADAVIALAFEHHLAIGRNAPLGQVVKWITGQAPKGVIEFVDKNDPTVRQMLALREDIFVDYTAAAFTNHLQRYARIVKNETISMSGRSLYWFDRS